MEPIELRTSVRTMRAVLRTFLRIICKTALASASMACSADFVLDSGVERDPLARRL
jgi:hypothetical protein